MLIAINSNLGGKLKLQLVCHAGTNNGYDRNGIIIDNSDKKYKKVTINEISNSNYRVFQTQLNGAPYTIVTGTVIDISNMSSVNINVICVAGTDSSQAADMTISLTVE